MKFNSFCLILFANISHFQVNLFLKQDSKRIFQYLANVWFVVPVLHEGKICSELALGKKKKEEWFLNNQPVINRGRQLLSCSGNCHNL